VAHFAVAIPGLWIAILVFFGARGTLQAARYPALAREFGDTPGDPQCAGIAAPILPADRSRKQMDCRSIPLSHI